MGGLEVVESLPHVPLRGEDDGLHAVLGVLDALLLTHLQHLGQDLRVGQFAVPQHGAARLDGLDDLLRRVAGQGEAGGVAVQLHGPPQGLLGGLRHGVRLVQDDDLVPAAREGHLLLGEHLDPVADDVDAALVGGVQLQNSVLKQKALKMVFPQRRATNDD